MQEIRTAMGYIETVGLAAAIAAADAALKAANVSLIGREISKGAGMVTVKLSGNVGAVKAAVAAGKAEGDRVSQVLAIQVIARPAQSHGPVMGYNADTMGVEEWLELKGIEEKPLSVYRPEGKRSTGKPVPAPAEPQEETVSQEPAPVQEPEPVEPQQSEPESLVEEKGVETPAPEPSVKAEEQPPVAPGMEAPQAPGDEKAQPVIEPEKPAPPKRSSRKKADASTAKTKPRSTTRRTRRKKTGDDTDTSGRT